MNKVIKQTPINRFWSWEAYFIDPQVLQECTTNKYWSHKHETISHRDGKQRIIIFFIQYRAAGRFLKWRQTAVELVFLLRERCLHQFIHNISGSWRGNKSVRRVQATHDRRISDQIFTTAVSIGFLSFI